MTHYFGIRHLSPKSSSAFLAFCERHRPDAILIEAPSDVSELMKHILHTESKPPVCILAYSTDLPVRTFMLPFAEYSPEYQAVHWGLNNGAYVEFIDLPSDIFLAFQTDSRYNNSGVQSGESVYERWTYAAAEADFDTYWERSFEQLQDDQFALAANTFGESLRSLDEVTPLHLVRERYMRRKLRTAEQKYSNIVVLCGAYHSSALKDGEVMTDSELAEMPRLKSSLTLMPYSYLRLSTKTGYGAGNSAPLYYETLWKNRLEPSKARIDFLSSVTRYLRTQGKAKSLSDTIDAVKLSFALAEMNGTHMPVLADLRSAAVSVLGDGELSDIAEALAMAEVGTTMGTLPKGVLRTPIQDDFYEKVKLLKLEKYCTTTAQTLSLSLRENTRSGANPFLDLKRSEFLHQLVTLEIGFCKKEQLQQVKGTWKELWSLQWTPEHEIQLVESFSIGETVEAAASYAILAALHSSSTSKDIAVLINLAQLCNLPVYSEAVKRLQSLYSDSQNLHDLTETAVTLANILSYGSVRKTDIEPIKPLLSQLYLHACMILPTESCCNQAEASKVLADIRSLNSIIFDHNALLDGSHFTRALQTISSGESVNPLLSGTAFSLLIEKNQLSDTQIEAEISLRLSPAVQGNNAASWIEGVTCTNHYALLSRSFFWRSIDEYISSLDEEGFMRCLVFLRRAFSDFSAEEKRDIFKQLGSLWNENDQEVEAYMAPTLSKAELDALARLSEYTFDD